LTKLLYLTQNDTVLALKKKKDQTTRRVVTVHCLSRFYPKITAHGATFKVHLIPHMCTKIDNTCIKMVT
jgi:hypothetical protein